VSGGASDAPPDRRPSRRFLVVLALALTLFVGARSVGGLEPGRIADLVRDAGPWGAGLYLLAFVVGELALVPGAILIAAAGLVYGPLAGSALAYVGSMAASATSFGFARRMGLRAPSVRMPRLVARGLEHLERRPTSTVCLLRLGFAAYPPLSLALAASSIRARDYLLGTALGLLLPVAAIATVAARLAP